MYKLTLSVILFLILPFCILAQESVLIDSSTTAEARKQFKENLISNTIEKNLTLPLNIENEKHWMSAFWGMELILYKNSKSERALKQALNNYRNHTEEFNRAALEAAYTLYPREFIKQQDKILLQTKSAKHFAMAFNYLNRANPSVYNYYSFEKFAAKNFSDWKNNPILFMLHTKLLYEYKKINRPSLVDLLAHNFEENTYALFSLQRRNRDYPGLLIIRKLDGKFLRDDKGSIFNVSQLARAISNLPGYLTNGNTPQGIFSIQGVDTSKNVFIGRTPNIQLVLPFETDAKQYFHSNENLIWDEALYKKLLPYSWQQYTPIYESFYAGKAGRNEIIAHGTTIELDYYTGQPYYPHTPTLGCLCTVEVWNGDDGKRIYSGQSALINALKNLNAFKGYLIVVEIDDKNSPVTLNDILTEVLHAEKNFVKLEE